MTNSFSSIQLQIEMTETEKVLNFVLGNTVEVRFDDHTMSIVDREFANNLESDLCDVRLSGSRNLIVEKDTTGFVFWWDRQTSSIGSYALEYARLNNKIISYIPPLYSCSKYHRRVDADDMHLVPHLKECCTAIKVGKRYFVRICDYIFMCTEPSMVGLLEVGKYFHVNENDVVKDEESDLMRTTDEILHDARELGVCPNHNVALAREPFPHSHTEQCSYSFCPVSYSNESKRSELLESLYNKYDSFGDFTAIKIGYIDPWRLLIGNGSSFLNKFGHMLAYMRQVTREQGWNGFTSRVSLKFEE